MRIEPETITLSFGEGVQTAPVSIRHLDEVRPMLQDPESAGPDPALWERLTRGA
jgi:hypothetical protein